MSDISNIINNKYYKIILYTSRIRFPKFPSYYFPFYMHVIYKRICQKSKFFIIKTIPNNLLIALLNKHAPFCNYDANNCVVISKRYCHQVGLGNYAKLNSSESPPRLVQILELNCSYDEIFVNENLRFNLIKLGYADKTKVSSIKSENIKFASDVEISLIKTHNDISNAVIDGVLKNYFKSPKLLYENDVIAINLKQYGPEFFYTNAKVCDIENIYFKCMKLKCEDETVCTGGYFCVSGETTLKESAARQGFVASSFTKVKNFEFRTSDGFNNCMISKCPYGLDTYLNTLERAVKPFLNNRKLMLKPAFLIQGPKGVGKNLIVATLADKLGMHFYKISSGDVSSSAYAQTEIKIKNIFFKAKLCSPCLLVVDKFEHFGKNNEGEFDERIINYFKNQLNDLLTNNSHPIILVCLSNSKDLPAELSRIFLEIFSFQAPTQTERTQILKWIMESKNLESEVHCDDIVSKTHGFLFEDLDALVYYAQKNWFSQQRGVDEETLLEEADFQIALDIMQSNYTESLGAPKVPKVQWSDVGGLNDVKQEIIRTINLPLKHPELLKASGLRRSGILLYGPPGTGKTLIAKAVATECSLCFLSVKGPELLNMYVGQSEQNVREVFEKARQAAPCIIFFDELESLAPNRGIAGDSGGVMDRIVSQLLSEMDGLNEAATIFVIGATNRPDLIDPALLRPGRYDKLLYVGPAEDQESKVAVLKALTRKFNLSENVDLPDIVENCPNNISGADFYGICSSAWMSAVGKLIKKIEAGELIPDDLTEKDVVVNRDDFEDAVKYVKPSISHKDLLYFQELKSQLSVNTKMY